MKPISENKINCLRNGKIFQILVLQILPGELLVRFHPNLNLSPKENYIDCKLFIPLNLLKNNMQSLFVGSFFINSKFAPWLRIEFNEASENVIWSNYVDFPTVFCLCTFQAWFTVGSKISMKRFVRSNFLQAGNFFFLLFSCWPAKFRTKYKTTPWRKNEGEKISFFPLSNS